MTLSVSDESQSMLRYHSVNYAKAVKAKDVREDIENNNDDDSNNKIGILDEEYVNVQYSSNSKGVLAQCLVTGAVLLLAAGGGMPIGYSAVLLPQLSENNGTMHVDRELGSWIASVHSLATPVGSLLSGPFLDSFGRKSCLQLSAVPLCLGWIVIGFAKSVSWILVGRVVAGFAVGLMAVPAQVLVGEMADPGLRGSLVGSSLAAYCFGILLIYAFGASFKWNVVALCGTVLPVLAFAALWLIPESPAWLIRRKELDRARKALLWLRGGDVEQVNNEIALLEARAKADVAQKAVATSLGDETCSNLSMILNPSVLKPLIIINIFNALQLISGTYVIVFYAVDLVRDIGGGNMDSYLAAVITAIIRFIFSMAACILLHKIGRRSLGLLSAMGTALASLVLAGYMLARTAESYADTYVVSSCLLIYVGANTIGLFTLPGLMTGELLPQKARGIGGGYNFFVFNLLLFVVTKCFPMVSKAVGITGVFAIFGASALLEMVFIYVALPETKDRTLEEIEDYFQQDNVLWITRTRQRKPDETLFVRNV